MLELPQTRLGKLSSERYGGSKDVSVMELLSKLQPAVADPGIFALPPSSNSKWLSLIEALRKDGLAKVLSEPSLMMVPDRPAYVLVGGEFPYPDKDVQGKEVANFKEYGTRLDVVAQIVSADRIHLDLRLRVSERDDAHGVQVGDEKIPALNSREMETGLDLRPGQTIVLGRLVERRMPTAAPAAAADTKRDAGGDSGEAGAVGEKFQLLTLVKAELVPKGIVDSAAVKPAIPRFCCPCADAVAAPLTRAFPWLYWSLLKKTLHGLGGPEPCDYRDGDDASSDTERISASLRDSKIKDLPVIRRADATHVTVRMLANAIRVQVPDPHAGVVTVSITTYDPGEAAAPVNAIVGAYMHEVVQAAGKPKRRAASSRCRRSEQSRPGARVARLIAAWTRAPFCEPPRDAWHLGAKGQAILSCQ